MYRDIALWNRVRTRVLENGESKTAASKAEGICTATVRKILRHTSPPGYNGAKPREARAFITHPSDLNTLLRENDHLPETARLSPKEIFEILQAQGYQGSSGAIRYHMHQHEDADEGYLWKSVQKLVRSLSDTDGTEFLASLFPKGTLTDKTEAASSRRQKIHAKQQMLSQVLVAQGDWTRWLSELERNGKLCPDALKAEDVQFLLRKLLPEKGRERKKSLVILARDHGFTITHIANFLDISINAAEHYIAGFNTGGIKELFRPKTKPKKENDEELKKMVFTLLHEPPSFSGLNRTTWRMSDLEIVLKEKGIHVGDKVLRKIIKTAGYRWKAARVVLTSTDPEYKEKLAHVQKILCKLQDDERFFSIDEFGPFSVTMKGGRQLASPSVHPTVPQWQVSKGRLIMTAALELSHNQVTHFFSSKKNSQEMIKLAKVLIQEYHTAHKLYLSWDAASWHNSRELASFLDDHNATAAAQCLPMLELVPLPASAQFLNIIESVFSGMARAIIHNSDYASKEAAMHAMDLYFAERNQHYITHPKPAGKKIWGMERTSSQFAAENNCKNPKYR